MNIKNVYIIAGANGSGKTTFANTFLPDYAKCRNFINADLIAKGLSPYSPNTAAIKAGRIMLEQIRYYAAKDEDFAFETTLAGKTYISTLHDLKEKGYSITTFFLWIPNATLALTRIKDRVASGGHNVPPIEVKRRFGRGLYNFFKYYKPLSDTWLLFNNAEIIPQLIAREKSGQIDIIDSILFTKIIKSARINLYDKK